MTVADDLRGAFLTSSLTDEQLAELIAVGEERTFAPGEMLFHEGRPASSCGSSSTGPIELSRRIGDQTMVVATMDEPGRWAGGLSAWGAPDEHAVTRATGVALTDCRVFAVPSPELGRLVGEWSPFAKHMISGVYQTIRSIDADRPPTRIARCPRHARRRARARDQQPGVGLDACRRGVAEHERLHDLRADRARGGTHRARAVPRGRAPAERSSGALGRRRRCAGRGRSRGGGGRVDGRSRHRARLADGAGVRRGRRRPIVVRRTRVDRRRRGARSGAAMDLVGDRLSGTAVGTR